MESQCLSVWRLQDGADNLIFDYASGDLGAEPLEGKNSHMS